MSTDRYLWERPSFFKIMIGPQFTKTMRIPPQFKHLGNNLPERVVLQRPGKCKWEVKLENVDGEVYFRQGWEEFVADNSVSGGEFLVFFYSATHEFDVFIYGTSGCEKENHRLLPLKEVKVEPGLEVCSEKNVMAIANTSWDEMKASKTVIRRTKYKQNTSHKLVKKRKAFDGKGSPSAANSKKKKEVQWNMNELCFKVMPALAPMKIENEKALKAACSFKSVHPHFVVTCRPSRDTYMPIPADLSRLYNIAEKDLVTIRDEAGRTWPIKISSWRDGRLCLSSGWSFAYQQNQLKNGDACLLEFVEQGNEINLHIFRASEFKEKPLPVHGARRGRLPKSGKERVLREAHAFKSKYPTFVVVWTRSILYHRNIPKKIVEQVNIKPGQRAVLYDPKGRSWPIKIAYRSSGQVEMGTGWSHFVKGNNFDVGDVCVLEFVKGTEEIQAHIFPVPRETKISPIVDTIELDS